MIIKTIISKTHGKFDVLIDNEDAWLFDMATFSITMHNGKPYCKTNKFLSKGNCYLHRLILFPANKEVIDHIDRNPLNNQRSNLRICLQKDNAKNRGKYKKKTSKFIGVCWAKYAKKWRATTKVNKKLIHLGYFSSEKDAAYARDNYLQSLNNEFFYLNNI